MPHPPRAPSKNWRRLIAPGIAAFITFWLLVGLGVWQLQRLKWKEGIIAQIHQAAISPAIPLPDNPAPFEKVSIAGRWVPGRAALYGDEVHDTPSGPIPGGEILAPLRRPNGQIVLVDLGWVPEQSPVPPAEPTGPVAPAGYLHAPIGRNLLSPPDEAARNLYYTLDPKTIGAGLGFSAVAPFILIAMGKLPPPGSLAPQPAQELPTPPNNHYGYALTWFGFAGVLVFECFFLVRKFLIEP